jgi:hypothetical protein
MPQEREIKNHTNLIICGRVSTVVTAIPNSKVEKCALCSEFVYVSASSIIAAGAAAIPICVPCAALRIVANPGEAVFMPMSDMQKAELKKAGVQVPFIVSIDPGRSVICDLCSKDWTDSPVSGGFIFLSKGVCPDCAPEFEKKVKKYNEEKYIRARCPEGISHAEWIRNVIR